ncbi:hypothetical protein DV702_02935 [Sporosarcina sp. PTS2304]|nr:hypothetical protein DV702_02935 [Sporosarcina sp. PTS2304]
MDRQALRITPVKCKDVLLRVKRSEKEHIFAFTGVIANALLASPPRALRKASGSGGRILTRTLISCTKEKSHSFHSNFWANTN